MAMFGRLIARKHGKEPIPGLLAQSKAHGGATVNRSGEDALPEGGYVVGIADETAERPRLGGVPKTERRRVYRAENRLLSRFASHRSFGTWIDQGHLHLDPVMTTKKRSEAMAIGRKHRQKAIFNVGTGEAEDVR